MFDIVQFLIDRGFNPIVSNNYVQSNCPIHIGDNPTGFIYWLESGCWRCWTKSCHDKYGHTTRSLVAGLLKVPINDQKISIEMAKYNRDSISNITNCGNYYTNDINSFQPLLVEPKLYWTKELINFNYSRKFCIKHRIGGLLNKHNNVTSIGFLIYDIDGHYIGYTKRTLESYRQYIYNKYNTMISKWIHSKGLKTNTYFYGERFLQKDINNVILVEGPKDVLFLNKNGFNNVLATFGLGLRHGQERRLVQWGVEKIKFFYDSDTSGLNYFETSNFKRVSKLCCQISGLPPKGNSALTL